MKRWAEGWGCLFATLSTLRDSDLGTTVTIRGKPRTVAQAIARQLNHYGYHIGQLVFIVRLLTGESHITRFCKNKES
jgi:hypothetical protein